MKLALSPRELSIKLRKFNVDPYEYTRYTINKVNVLLLPYIYILNPDIRNSIKIDLKDAIIIFDEAHNVVNAAEQALSYQFKPSSIL